MGPVVVTADEFGDPQAKRISCRVNGVTKQDASTADMIFPVATIIEWLSKGLTLEPGDIIATGTPEGVGMGRTPQEFLQDGDVVETEIEGIGTMRNRIGGMSCSAGSSDDARAPIGRPIREVIENWALWRDAGDWERFATVWHDDGWMTATWFQGPARDFIRVSREGFEKGVSILHFLGGFTCDIAGDRAISQTKMTINQRATVDDVLVDVVCTGRFYDFLEKREGRWAIVRRQPIYEKDRMDPVDPAARADARSRAARAFPEGYRHLGYLQSKIGFTVKTGLPGLRGPAVEKLYAEGAAWLAGSPTPGDPL